MREKLRRDTPAAKHILAPRVNLLLLESAEIGRPLPRTDRRVDHVLHVLRRNVGDTLDAGIVNGPRGKATVVEIAADTLTFHFTPTTPPPAASPLALLVGLPRPQTARDILRDATTLGVSALHFVRTEKAEASYAQSTLWSGGEWRRHVLAGAEQAFATQIPEVTWTRPLVDHLASPALPGEVRLVLDNYESPAPLGGLTLTAGATVTLAIGAERGWSAAERDRFRGAGFRFVHLGERVLRAETAVVAALAILRAKLGLA